MADKRKLLLEVDVDADGKPLRQLGDDAEHAESGFKELNEGLKKLDTQFDETAKRAADLRAEIAKSGDLALVKDLQKAERELKKLGRDRKTVVGDMAGAGASAAEDFSLSFSQKIGPLLAKAPVGPVGLIIGGTIAAAAAPIIGATIGAALLGAAAGGGIIGGVVLASKSQAVKAATSNLSREIGRDLKVAAKPFEAETVKSVGIIRDAFRAAEPDIQRLFSSTSKFLEPLTRGATTGAGSFLSGFTDAAEGAGPVIREVSQGLAELGDAAGDVFRSLSDDGAAAGDALGTVFDFLSKAIRGAGAAVNFLTETYGFLRQTQAFLQGDTATLTQYVMDDAQSKLDAAEKTKQLADSNGVLAVGYQSVNDAARTAAEGARLFNDTISELLGNQLSVDKANLAVKQGFADLNKELRDGKKSLFDNTQEARDNSGAILDQIGALERARQAQIDNGATVEDANKRFDEGIGKIQANAEKLHFNRDEVNKLIGAYKNIPGSVSTDVKANTGQARDAISRVVSYLNSVDGKTSTMYVKVKTDSSGTDRITSSTGGGRTIEPKAIGGPVKAGQPYIVGEKRPELFVPDSNGVIVPNLNDVKASSRPGIGGMSGGNTYHLTVINNGPVASSVQFEAMVDKAFNNLVRKGKVDAPA